MRPAAPRLLAAAILAIAGLGGCGSGDTAAWVDEEVTFTAEGLTIHGTYRHRGATPGPAALLISESGRTDRNGDNDIAGPVGNMRQLAEYLSQRGVSTLRYDKVGTGATGLGRYADRPEQVGSAVYTSGAEAAVRFLAGRPGVPADRISVYAVGEGAVHALKLADDTAADAPRIHSLGLLQPLPSRYLDMISARVKADVAAAEAAGAKTPQQGAAVLSAWRGAVEQARATGTAPPNLPDGLSAILNPGNVAAVVEADAIDPEKLAAELPAGMPVLLTCSDADGQARCTDMAGLRAALRGADLQFVELTGVNHVLREDPTDSVVNYARPGPLAPQLTAALDQFATR